ncbi:Ferredoxin--NADP(+) reductase [hydrothermal vent metagenome]|uniref:ferredoxin--NADP(+) reductase n=1 Tax=hydrothermal vent metagenome TaxID=652676 RepID=A0A3B0WSB5_9ZZZZ
MANWLTGKVIEKTQWNKRLFSLRIACDFNKFESGQFVRVALDINSERIARPYSVVSTAEDSYLEIYFNIVLEGPLSPKLAVLEVNDEIFVTDKANGFLTVAEVPECKNLWMLATGTGVGPFLSILKSKNVWQRFEKIILGYSVRDFSELSYQAQIAEIEKQYSNQFAFVPFITREKIDNAMRQRITLCIEDGSFEKRVDTKIDNDSHIMMCGNWAMISGVTEALEKRGLRKHRRREPGHITTEKYH